MEPKRAAAVAAARRRNSAVRAAGTLVITLKTQPKQCARNQLRPDNCGAFCGLKDAAETRCRFERAEEEVLVLERSNGFVIMVLTENGG